MIRTVIPGDELAIAHIYNHYITHTFVTFETEPVSATEILSRVSDTLDNGLPWLVAENAEGEVVGYAYASKWRTRHAYRFSVESTVYLDPDYTGKGLGKKLTQALFKCLKETSYHTVISGIALPNPASVAMHESLGMSKVARFEQVGFKFDRWIDVGYWQLRL